MSASISKFQILALNDAETSENRIHSDEIAKKHGFSSALVSGVNVFGYLSQPLVRAYGEAWLTEGIMNVIFIKPAYQDSLLTIETENLGQESSQRSHLSTAQDEQGTPLARLETWLPNELPAPQPLADMPSGKEITERPMIHWDAVQLQQPAPYYDWLPTDELNQEYVHSQRDQSDVYSGSSAPIHPYLLLDAANKALMRLYFMPAWVHTGSNLVVRKCLRAGDAIQIRSMPIEKWERKGHQFVKLYVAMWVNGEVAVEIEHSAIFRLA